MKNNTIFDFIISLLALALAKLISYTIHIPVVVSMIWLIAVYSYYVYTRAETDLKKDALERTRLILLIAIFITLIYGILWILIL